MRRRGWNSNPWYCTGIISADDTDAAEKCQRERTAAEDSCVFRSPQGVTGWYCVGMSSLLNFFTRDNRFFDLLEQSAVEAQNGATIIGKLLAQMGHGPVDSIMGDLDETRRKHKRVSQEVTEALTKVFVTPIEREDIEALSAALYKITKNCEKIGDRIAICPPGSDLRTVTKQVAMLGQAGDVVAKMVHELRRKAHGEQVRDFYERLQTIEGEADHTMNEQLRELYTRTDTDARQVVFWKDIFELLEKGVDRCRDAGYIVFHIVLKNS